MKAQSTAQHAWNLYDRLAAAKSPLAARALRVARAFDRRNEFQELAAIGFKGPNTRHFVARLAAFGQG